VKPIAAVLLLMAAAAALPDRAWACTTEQGFHRLTTTEAEVAYRFDPPTLKVGQFFAAEVIACRAPGGEPVREVLIDATMPAHGHGMNYRPSSIRTGDGHYRFTGLMLHMPGAWQITVDLVQETKRSRLVHGVNLAR
jgi:YtkA-like